MIRATDCRYFAPVDTSFVGERGVINQAIWCAHKDSCDDGYRCEQIESGYEKGLFHFEPRDSVLMEAIDA